MAVEPDAGSSKLDTLRNWLRTHEKVLAVAVVAWAGFFLRSWEGDLHGDPVHYAAVSKTILTTGDWITMHDAPGVVYPNKPPLMFWLTAATFRVFGFSNWSAKLWSCLFAFGGCLLAFLIGRRLFDETVGMLAGAMMAAMPGITINAIDCRLDSAVTFYTLLAVYGALRAATDERPVWLLLPGLAAGLGAMTKASTLVHVPVLVAIVLVAWRPWYLIHPWLLASAALAAAIAAPWHIAVVARLGAAYTEPYVGEQIGSRIALGSHLLDNVGRNVVSVSVRGLPWWPLGAWALIRWRRAEAPRRRAMAVAALWIVAVIALMAVPPKNYGRYVIQAYPAVAPLAAVGLAALLPERARDAMPRVLRWLVVLQVFALATLPVELHNYNCTGFTTARPLLDRLTPGAEIACHYPKAPSGRRQPEIHWGLRTKVYWYLDREVVNYATPAEVAAAAPLLLITRDDEVEALTSVGYDLLLELDGSYRLMWRRPPAGTGSAQGRGAT